MVAVELVVHGVVGAGDRLGRDSGQVRAAVAVVEPLDRIVGPPVPGTALVAGVGAGDGEAVVQQLQHALDLAGAGGAVRRTGDDLPGAAALADEEIAAA